MTANKAFKCVPPATLALPDAALQRRLTKTLYGSSVKLGHFEFEAKLMVWGCLAFIGLVLVAGLILPWLMEQVAIDRVWTPVAHITISPIFVKELGANDWVTV